MTSTCLKSKPPWRYRSISSRTLQNCSHLRLLMCLPRSHRNSQERLLWADKIGNKPSATLLRGCAIEAWRCRKERAERISRRITQFACSVRHELNPMSIKQPLLTVTSNCSISGKTPSPILSPHSRLVANWPRLASNGMILDEIPRCFYHCRYQSALRSRHWISCKVAEGRALRRHGNRILIIYQDRQVPTLDPESTGDMRFGKREFKHFQNLFFHFPGKRGLRLLGPK